MSSWGYRETRVNLNVLVGLMESDETERNEMILYCLKHLKFDGEE